MPLLGKSDKVVQAEKKNEIKEKISLRLHLYRIPCCESLRTVWNFTRRSGTCFSSSFFSTTSGQFLRGYASNGARSPKLCIRVYKRVRRGRIFTNARVYLARSWAFGAAWRPVFNRSFPVEFDDPFREERTTTTCTLPPDYWHLDYTVEERSTTCTPVHSKNVTGRNEGGRELVVSLIVD